MPNGREGSMIQPDLGSEAGLAPVNICIGDHQGRLQTKTMANHLHRTGVKVRKKSCFL